MALTADYIVSVSPAAKPYAAELVRQMAEAEIMANSERASKFLAQVHVESGAFSSVTESLNYSAVALKKLFGRHRISAEDADKFGRTPSHPANQNALANILYGGKFGRENLGNTKPGDGWRFRGRGLKQLTGRDNYRRFSLAWLGDESLLDFPDRVAEPAGAVASAVWFWVSMGLNQIADKASVEVVTKVVNGGHMGLADRIKWTAVYRNGWK